MSTRHDAVDVDVVSDVRAAVAAALVSARCAVLAISGGRDSMALLDAAAAATPECIAAVAVFDHGSGAAATRAANLVVRRARDLGLHAVRERAAGPLRGEAAWREARWEFLWRVAAEARAPVATAHTRDDQVETVFMRALRGASARGLAALEAPSSVLRPLLDISRDTIAAYARARRLRWIEDPSNRSRRHLRNRVRLDLLPALEQVRPGLAAALLAIGERAAELRHDVEAFVNEAVCVRREGGALVVARAALLGYDAPGLRLLLPAIAARAGITLDRRGTARLATFIIQGRPGGRIQLSGGYEVVRHREELRLRAVRPAAAGTIHALRDGLLVGEWRFRRGGDAVRAGLWAAELPSDRPLRVRAWRPGDRMTPHGAVAPRRVKGLLRDAGIDAASRMAWPVVLADEEIVWIPGVRRSSAATVRSGRPGVLYHCERLDD